MHLQVLLDPPRFQSTFPRRERRLAAAAENPQQAIFQSTLPRRERHKLEQVPEMIGSISIHAPAKGATLEFLFLSFVLRFQSTLPRRERPAWSCRFLLQGLISIHAPAKGATFVSMYAVMFSVYFNPRSREGSDRLDGSAVEIVGKFQSTLPRRERLSANVTTYYIKNDFNPRSREGSDKKK